MFTKLYKDKNYYYFFKVNLLIFFLLLVVMYVSGYFVIPAIDSIGFGYGVYKANLLTFFDPRSVGMNYSWSIILGDIYNTGGELEGFSYFGLGVIFLLLFLLYSFSKIKFLFRVYYKFFVIFFLFFILLVLFFLFSLIFILLVLFLKIYFSFDLNKVHGSDGLSCK